MAALAMARTALAQTTNVTAIEKAPAIEQRPNPNQPAIPASLRVTGDTYHWSWTASDDRFRIEDTEGREIAAAELQPMLALKVAGIAVNRPGALRAVTVASDRVDFEYAIEPKLGTMKVSLRFAHDRLWFEPVQYHSEATADVIELRWFSALDEGVVAPRLSNHFLIVPGLCMSDGLSPIVTAEQNLDATVWLGRGAQPAEDLFQQWGLPTHYFAGYSRDGADGARASVPGKLSAAFCCGLETVPNADMLLKTKSGQHSVIFRYRSDLWGHARTPGQLSLGGRLLWTFAANWRDAIRAYYRAVRESTIRIAPPSNLKRAAMTGSTFSMWGAQVASGKIGDKITQAELEDIYESLHNTGLKIDTFVIEDRWESFHGSLVHDEVRFPQFEPFLERLRADGIRPALWVTPLRCQSPSLIGLEPRHLLRDAKAAPTQNATLTAYSILDVSQPEVADNIARRLQAMMHRYRPGFIKFDFGYEMPPLSMGAPADMAMAGERLLLKAAELLSSAVRAVDPNVVILYYGLSPFMVPFTDLHSPDDVFASGGDYDIEINRRIYFSSLLGELGMPTYGSGGYDWQSMPSIWFDTVLSGPLGILADPRGDERGQRPTAAQVALFNGLRAATRHTTNFTIETLPADPLSPVKGAHSASWIRREHGEIVGISLRHEPWMGSPGTSELAGILESTTSVVMTSMTEDSLTRASVIAIVPLADGQVRLRRERGSGGRSGTRGPASLTHYFADGSVTVRTGTIRDGWCVADLKTKSHNGIPIQWCELQFPG